MTTQELAMEANKLMKKCKKQIAELERTAAKLAAALGVNLNLVKK
jgi:hypothetical protein